MSFIPLHIYSPYAILETGLTFESLFKHLQSLNITHVGISDPEHLSSYPHFEKSAKKHGITPYFGLTLYDDNNQLVFYIKNSEGYYELLRLKNALDEKRLDAKTFKENTANLITILVVNTGDLMFRSDEVMRDLFKKYALVTTEFYLGANLLDANEESLLFNVAEKYNYNVLNFPLIKWAGKDDYERYLMAQAIKNGVTLEESELFAPDILGEAIFKEDKGFFPLSRVVEQINFSFSEIKKITTFPKTSPLDPQTNLEDLTFTNLKKLGLANKEYTKRLEEELSALVSNLGFASYFLLVSDYVNFAKENGILVGYGRGSAASSLISYLLNITNVDPLKHDLIFERFLNPARSSLPDIDIDFMDIKREDVIAYLKEKYGKYKVSNIITFQKLGVKGALREASRIYNFDLRYVEALLQSINSENETLADNYRNNKAFRSLVDSDSYYLKIVRKARIIETLVRNSGIHAAGIIIDADDLPEYIPVKYQNDVMISEFEMDTLEQQGFLKFDLLGLTNLSFAANIMKRIQTIYQTNIDFYNISYDDPALYKTIKEGQTLGLFQLESSGMKKVIKAIEPSTFDDICLLLALYRPGPLQYVDTFAARKKGKEEVSYLSEELQTILAPTQGIIIYQEQIMQIGQKMASLSFAEADLLRRAISSKDEQFFLSLKDKFYEGAQKNGYSIKDITKTFTDILKFANYGFNKAHSVSYSMLTLTLAYFKTFYPLAFYIELLETTYNDSAKFKLLRDELKFANILLLPPSFEKSQNSFTVEHNSIRLPFYVIKGISKELGDKLCIIRKKETINDATSFFFFAHQYGIGKNEIIALIEAGVLDFTKLNRPTLIRHYEQLEFHFAGNLFNDPAHYASIGVTILPDNLIENVEKEINRLSYSISGNPYALYLEKHPHIQSISALTSIKKNIQTIGFITKQKTLKTKNGEEMMFATLSDYDQEIEMVLFPEVLKEVSTLLFLNKSLIVSGYTQLRNEKINLVVTTIEGVDNEQ